MKIQIVINDVGDGDAIFIGLSSPEKTLTIVLDAGKTTDGAKIIKQLEPFLQSYDKSAPDLIIGSHYDNDHIGGLMEIIEYYGKNIGELWMFDTTNFIKAISQKPTEDESMFPSESDTYAGGVIGTEKQQILEEYIKTVAQEQQLLQYARKVGIKIKEPIAGICKLEGWDEIELIGPTQEYYDALFPSHLRVDQLIQTALEAREVFETDNVNPCDIHNKKKSPVSAINLNSSIMIIKVGGKKFLFTGDAGIDSFYAIPDYKSVVKNIFWLKMPHHCSANNINMDLLNLMNSDHIVISGKKHISESLLKCLRTVCKSVQSTSEEGNIEYKFL